MVLIYPISGINKRETSAKRSLPGESYGSFIAVGHRVRSRFTNFEYEKIRKRAGGGGVQGWLIAVQVSFQTKAL